MRAVAIHLIWTTYLTWLPGDDRGHWSPLFDMYGSLVQAGRKLNVPDESTRRRATTLATEPAKVLTESEMQLVASIIGAHVHPCVTNHSDPGQGRGYVTTPLRFPPPRCLAAAVESNHLHLLIGPCEEDLDRFVGRLKGRTSSELGKLPSNAGRKKTWTEGFWKVFLFEDEATRAVRRYIEAHNERRGLPASPYDWISPT